MNYKTLNYIIRFLLGDDVSQNLVTTIGYTDDCSLFHKYTVVIIPSGFFSDKTYGRPSSLPSLPLYEIEGVPLLFGTPRIEKKGATLVVHADIIASTYFLISRYEEMLKRNVRDEYGRFPGKESLPYRAGFIHRPIVDEYRMLLRRWLQENGLKLPPLPTGIRQIYLTHDVDAPFLYRSWKGFIRCLLDTHSLKQAIKAKFGPVENDPYYTFPWIFKTNNLLLHLVKRRNVQSFYFIKAGGNTKQDKPVYNLNHKDIQHLLNEIKQQKATIGLHTSFQAGENPSFIPKEKKRLEKILGKKITHNRHHFLACRQPEDTDRLEAAGIAHDYTMGYADIAGFRLGTSHPVRAINPTTRRLSPLTLHPLLIMESTLDNPRYMNLKEQEATIYCLELFEQVKRTGGDIVLLWHNTSFIEKEGNYQSRLYTLLLNELTLK